jgi:hypothetical protein
MALAIVGQVGDDVPLPIGLDVDVVTHRRRRVFQPNIGQVRILQADKVFQLSISCGPGKCYRRRGLPLVPRPAHAPYLALR